MSSFHLHFVFLLCVLWITNSSGSLTLKMLQNRNVIITPPQDVTIFLRTQDRIIVAWTLPQIYVPHDTSPIAFEKLKNGDQVDVLKPMFSYDPHTATAKPTTNDMENLNANTTQSSNLNGTNVSGTGNTTSSGSETKNDDNAKPTKPTTTETVTIATSDNDNPKPPTKVPVTLNEVVCQPLTYFADFTVGEKKAGISDNGWSVSLLESTQDIPATNVSMFYLEKEHKVVKFEEGCVTKVVVTYSGVDSRPEEKEIVLNASDHLVTIDNLKRGKEYKIVVTAHFVSGDAISAKAIYVATLQTGFICRCDWHGTKNRTSDCSSPSTTQQHCECHNAYTGRFCQDCAYGFYRDSPGDSCKKCNCGDHGAIKTSCGFVEGFLKCHHCAKGYTGNICHKCAKGYFRILNECKPCLCNGRTRPDAPLMCHPTTGECIDCQYNTTGFYCERCLPGYRLSQPHIGTCQHLSDFGLGPSSPSSSSPSSSSHSSSSHSGVSTGVIGAVIFVIVLFVIVIAGIFICRRVRANRQRRALWTVEMRPDNEDLDFNSVHNEDARMDEIDDMDFYDKQLGRSRSGGKYSKLNEEC